MDWLIEKDDNNTSNYSRYKKEKKKYIKILAEKTGIFEEESKLSCVISNIVRNYTKAQENLSTTGWGPSGGTTIERKVNVFLGLIVSVIHRSWLYRLPES